MPRDVQNMSLLHRKQGANETIEVYSYALSVLFSRSSYPAQVKIDLSMAGLKEEYREAVILAYSRGPVIRSKSKLTCSWLDLRKSIARP